MAEVKLTKREVLELIKSIDIGEQFASEKKDRQNWFKFGAYDALRTLSQKVTDYKPPTPEKISIVEKVKE